jgi:hypothetical protein
MSVTIGRFQFDGPYDDVDDLEDRSGVYAILCRNNGNYDLIDVGESATVATRVANHDRAGCWSGSCRSKLMVAVHYTPYLQQSGRQEIEGEIRSEYDPPCGER